MIDPKKIVSDFIFFDMSNLPSLDWMSNLEEATEGLVEVLPQKTLRERSYEGGGQSLRLRPDYQGDFLKMLEDRSQKYSSVVKNAMEKMSDPYPSNLYDFTMPSEMLKHQENPDLDGQNRLDRFTEFSSPDNLIDDVFNGLGGTNGFFYDLYEIPEMTCDKALRERQEPDGKPYWGSVVANYLSEVLPVELAIDCSPSVRVAKLLEDLARTQIWSKGTRRYRDLNTGTALPRLSKAEPKMGRWTFKTGSRGYATVFQFIPHSNVRDVKKLHVRVSCSCPSFLYWGAQYNALTGGYMYGKIRPKYMPPKVRDPENKFLVCKHILSCIPIISTYKMAPTVKKYKFRYEVEPAAPAEPIKIPAELKRYDEDERIQTMIEGFEDLSAWKQRAFVMKQKDPDFLSYLAHKFPKTATSLVAEALNILKEKSPNPQVRKDSEEILTEIEEKKEKEKKIVPKLPAKYRKFETPERQKAIGDWTTWDEEKKKEYVSGIGDPEILGYLAYKFSDEEAIVGEIIKRLVALVHSPNPKIKSKADEILREIA